MSSMDLKDEILSYGNKEDVFKKHKKGKQKITF